MHLLSSADFFKIHFLQKKKIIIRNIGVWNGFDPDQDRHFVRTVFKIFNVGARSQGKSHVRPDRLKTYFQQTTK